MTGKKFLKFFGLCAGFLLLLSIQLVWLWISIKSVGYAAEHFLEPQMPFMFFSSIGLTFFSALVLSPKSMLGRDKMPWVHK